MNTTPTLSEAVPKLLRENYDRFGADRLAHWPGYLDHIKASERVRYTREPNTGYGREFCLADLPHVCRFTAKQTVEYRGQYTAVYYTITAEMADGTQLHVREVGPYKFARYRPEWQGGSLDAGICGDQAKHARIGARMERDLELWALNELLAEARNAFGEPNKKEHQ